MRYIFALWKPNGKAPAWSEEYSPLAADRLVRSIKKHSGGAEFTCITDFHPDEFVEDITCVPFIYPARDWSSMLELYRPELVKDKAILLGLDTIAVGDLSPIEELVKEEHCHVMPMDPYHAPLTCNAVVGVSYDTAQEIYFKAMADLSKGAKNDPRYKMFGFFSEMAWLRANAEATSHWDDAAPGLVRSYKVHVKPQGMMDSRLVYFHGTPKPSQIKEPWVEANWE